MELNELKERLDGLVIFRALLDDPVIAAFRAMLESRCRGENLTASCAEFESRLFESGDNWSEYLTSAVVQSENVCVRHQTTLGSSPVLRESLRSELELFDRLASLRLGDFADGAENFPSFLQSWNAAPCDISGNYMRRLSEIGKKGYGVFARYHVFTVEDGRLTPVRYPDPQKLSDLPGYEREREKILANTRALLEGKPANNVLLYGDAGTGKSSTVKAIANEFARDGLRLVEVKKNQLYQIPDLMETLAKNPLKFILFIDDLSFSSNDDNFAALKAILEGGVCCRARNLAVYATSNRRHLIKETMTDRTGDDIHEADTRQELMSLSARFGLTVTFSSPDKGRYLHIVRELASQYSVDLTDDQLATRSEAFAIRAGGRSARTARQFVELCKSGVTA